MTKAIAGNARADGSLTTITHRKLCTKEAAAFLSLSTSLLNKLRCTGGGPAFIKIGSRCLYDMADLETWVASKKKTHT